MLVVRIPVDYFAPSWRERAREHRRTALGWVGLILKNLLGLLLLVAGIVMLILPGQGIITMLIGLMLMNFPGKYSLERALVARPRVLRTINWMRAKWNREPLIVDPTEAARAHEGRAREIPDPAE